MTFSFPVSAAIAMTLKPLESVLKTVMHQKAWQHQRHLQTITTLWQQLLPPKTKLNSYPHSIKNNTLFIATSNDTWSQHLTLQRLNIQKKLNAKLPPSEAIQNIRFTSTHWHQKPAYSPLADPDSPHPSRTTSRSPQAKRAGGDSPSAAVRAWLTKQQQQLENQPPCPKCHVPTPPGELKRWQVCRCCIAQKWHHKQNMSQQLRNNPTTNQEITT
ncbi:DciA family protein [[Limnothrix rosea] IAM M-220]|uniref:DciA family protein n=1 Tax=[Limnothrix rosea] IAM M-220 TaxID=454133 RepID=UPI0015590DC2|nr:DciA family protein [[Limnothrix rosea] IAM M-220]